MVTVHCFVFKNATVGLKLSNCMMLVLARPLTLNENVICTLRKLLIV